MMIRAVSVSLLAAFLCSVSGALAAEPADVPSWPEFHGPRRDNISRETGLLKKWPDGGPKLIWKYSNCGVGYSGVSIAEGKIFTAGDFDDVEMVIALDMNGKLLWKSPNGESWQLSCPGSRATPTYHEGWLYHMNPSGRLAAYQASTGKELWTVDLKARFEARHGVWALAENVIIEGDNVLCMPGGPKGRIVALDKRTGKTVWANTDIEHHAAYCSPAVVTHDGVRQMLSLTQKSVVSVDVETGKLLWSHPFVPRSPQNALTPLYHDGYVFVACGHSSGGMLLKINPDQRGATQVWWREELDNCHGGLILLDGKLYGCGCRLGGKKFFCVDFLTGDVKKFDGTLGKVALSYADGMLYALNHQGMMSLLKITPEAFELVSQFDLGKKPANTYLAHPVICGGRLYLRFDEHLCVYDIRAR